MDYITVFPWKFLERAIGSVENSWVKFKLRRLAIRSVTDYPARGTIGKLQTTLNHGTAVPADEFLDTQGSTARGHPLRSSA